MREKEPRLPFKGVMQPKTEDQKKREKIFMDEMEEERAAMRERAKLWKPDRNGSAEGSD